MISPEAIKAFLARSVDDHSWIKTQQRGELMLALAGALPQARLDELMQHQLAMLALGIAYPTFAFWAGMGVGKTLLALRLIEYWWLRDKLRKAVIMVPSLESALSWRDEFVRWKFPYPYQVLIDETSADKAVSFMRRREGVLVVPYPSFNYMASAKRPVYDREGLPTGKQELVPQKKLLDRLCDGLGAVINDESTECRNHQSLQFKLARELSFRVPIRYALAGRPIGRDPMDLWPQQFLVDHGESLGRTLGMFREAFFDKKKRYWGGPFSFDYVFRPAMADQLHRLSGHRSIRYSTEECVDLPPLTRIVKRVQFPPENLTYYRKVIQHLISVKGDRTAAFNDFCKMRQLSSGFMGVEADGAKLEVEFEHVPKLDVLMEIVNQLPQGAKTVVWFEFIHSGKMLNKRLREEKIPHVWIWSGTKNRQGALERFLKDPDCAVMLINHQIGAYSLNLQCASTMIFFESPVGVIERDQAERRCWRKGSSRRVFLFDLITEGSVDGKILDFHRQGKSLFETIYKNPADALI